MKNITSHLKEISTQLSNEFDIRYIEKYITQYLLNYVIIFGMLLFAASSFIFGKITLTLATGIIALIHIVNQYFLIKQHTIDLSAVISIITLTISFLLSFILLNESFPVIVFMVFPALAILLMATHIGSIWVGGFYLIIALLYFFWLPVNEEQIITFVYFTIGYIFSYGLSMLLDLHRTSTFEQIEKKLFDVDRQTKEKDEFISKLSHQIRTPLNNILAIASLINETELTKEQQNMLDTIQASASNLVTVANSIKEAKIQKVTAQEDDVALTFNLNSTIKSTLKLFQTSHPDKVNIRFNYPDEFPEKLLGNPVKIKQIFLNLIENLITHREKDHIIIDISLEGKEKTENATVCHFKIQSNSKVNLPLELTAQHTESIIDVEQNQNIFDDLRNLNIIDLSITRDIIESENGKFYIRAGQDETAYSFTLSLKKPIKATEDKAKATQTEDQSYLPDEELEQQQGAVSLKDAYILLAEDNKINQKIMRLSLQKYVNKIDFADNGKEALDMFGSTRYDIILMDVQMPVMDGIKTTVKMREIEKSTGSHTPIVAITANALLGDKETCISAGMDDYVSKPFRIEKLIELLEYHLGDTK